MNDSISIRGARVHNLKNISLAIPHDQLTVITGVSGSGKSSLAFDTIYAEGQRRYVESLSAYARQFLERMEKPDVDEIDGIAPAVAIRQKNTTRNPRSTVATSTECYDFLRLLFARVGQTFCPNCGTRVRKDTVDEVAAADAGAARGLALVRAVSVRRARRRRRRLRDHLFELRKKGFNRLFQAGGCSSSRRRNRCSISISRKPLFVLVDRLAIGAGPAPAAGGHRRDLLPRSGRSDLRERGRRPRRCASTRSFQCKTCGMEFVDAGADPVQL